MTNPLQVRVAHARHRVDWLEAQLGKPTVSQSTDELTEELARWRRELTTALRLRDEAETDRRLCELQQSRTALMTERGDHRRHLTIFGRVARWQHVTTYLLYLVLIMNVVITTFGISGESLGSDVGGIGGLRESVDRYHGGRDAEGFLVGAGARGNISSRLFQYS